MGKDVRHRTLNCQKIVLRRTEINALRFSKASKLIQIKERRIRRHRIFKTISQFSVQILTIDFFYHLLSLKKIYVIKNVIKSRTYW